MEENTQIDEELHGSKVPEGDSVAIGLPPTERLPTATSEATGQWGTGGGIRRVPKRVKSLRERFLDWLISWLLPGFHLAINPPKGYKRPRKVKVINEDN